MTDYQFSDNGYWIDPDGTIHAMTEWQIHRSWINKRLYGDELIGHMNHADNEAVDNGWARITFANINRGFDVYFDRELVTKEAVRSVRRILKDHQPDNNIVIISEKFDLVRDADRALAQYPNKYQIPTVVVPMRVEPPPLVKPMAQPAPYRPTVRKARNSPERQEELQRQFIERLTMSRIDDQLLELVKNTKAQLHNMPNARPSQIMAVKEQFVLDWREITKNALLNLTIEEKLAAFDAIVEGAFEVIQSPEKWTNQRDDADHYIYEDVISNAFGPNIWDSLNALDDMDLPEMV